MKITSHRNEFTLTGTHTELEALASLIDTAVTAYAEYGEDLSADQETVARMVLAGNERAADSERPFALESTAQGFRSQVITDANREN